MSGKTIRTVMATALLALALTVSSIAVAVPSLTQATAPAATLAMELGTTGS